MILDTFIQNTVYKQTFKNSLSGVDPQHGVITFCLSYVYFAMIVCSLYFVQPCITLNWQTLPSRAEVVSLVQHCKPVSWYQCVHISDMSEYIWMKNVVGKVSVGERKHKKSHKTLWKNLKWCKMYYVTRWLSTNIINLRQDLRQSFSFLTGTLSIHDYCLLKTNHCQLGLALN